MTYYIALDDLNFDWRPSDLHRVAAWYREGKPLSYMASYLRRDHDEVALLVMDLSRRGEIEPRPSGYLSMRKGRWAR